MRDSVLRQSREARCEVPPRERCTTACVRFFCGDGPRPWHFLFLFFFCRPSRGSRMFSGCYAVRGTCVQHVSAAAMRARARRRPIPLTSAGSWRCQLSREHVPTVSGFCSRGGLRHREEMWTRLRKKRKKPTERITACRLSLLSEFATPG